MCADQNKYGDKNSALKSYHLEMIIAKRFKLNEYYKLPDDMYGMLESLENYKCEPGIGDPECFYIHHFLHYLR